MKRIRQAFLRAVLMRNPRELLMDEMKQRLRYFFVDEEEVIHKIPFAKYERIFRRAQPIMLFAGRSVRFIEAHVEVDEGGVEHLVNAFFRRHDFDAEGLWDKKEKQKSMIGAMEMLSHVGDADWAEFYKAEHLDPFTWKPTPDLIERLKEAVRDKKKHS
jgi:hypothetical protein